MIKMLSKKFAKFLISKPFSRTGLRCLSLSASNLKERNVAVVLSGCGVYDGSEITEAVSAMVHLSRHNANIAFFAPNIEQLHVVNHAAGSVEPESRNVMCEAARIARGNIQALDKLKGANFDALIVPGGFGAAKNLCNYALNGEQMTVNPEMERVINEFVTGTKPIGLCCIAPVIAAKLLPGCVLTVGKKDSQNWPYAGTIDSLKNIGASVVEKDVNEIAVDDKYRVVTTPAFMKNASFYEVFNGIGSMVDQVMKLCN